METGNVPFDPKVFLATVNGGRTISNYRIDEVVFAQGDPADAVFYIQKGKVKLTVLSEQGKEAIVAVMSPNEFCGEGCLSGQPLRMATAVAMTECEIMRLDKEAIIRVLHDEPAFSEMFVSPGTHNPGRRRPNRPTFQFKREALGTCPSIAGEFWQGGPTRDDNSEGQPRDARGDDWRDTLPREFFYEQVSKLGPD